MLRPIQPQHTSAIKRIVGLHLITTCLKPLLRVGCATHTIIEIGGQCPPYQERIFNLLCALSNHGR